MRILCSASLTIETIEERAATLASVIAFATWGLVEDESSCCWVDDKDGDSSDGGSDSKGGCCGLELLGVNVSKPACILDFIVGSKDFDVGLR